MSDMQAINRDYYGYTPSEAWAISFVVLFSVIAAIHSLQALKSRYWIVYPTLVLGALVEVIGWAARLWSSQNVDKRTAFLMQIVTLIIAPVFFSAFDYIILGVAIRKLGPKYSVLRPSWYLIIFLTADMISLVLQAVGGGRAASTADEGEPTDSATDIMVAGIIFQLIVMVVFVILGLDFIVRVTTKKSYAFRERQIAAKALKPRRRDSEKSDRTVVVDPANPTRANSDDAIPKPMVSEDVNSKENVNRWWIMLAGCFISSLAIIIRGVFRSIELSDGWKGSIATNEMLTNGLDGIPMVIAVGIFNIINPLWVLPKRESWKGFH